MGVRAIDVSRYQGRIDWKQVAASGVRGAWVKVGGADGGFYKDPRADENLAGAQAAGLEVGTYYFCNPSLSPVDQAKHAVDCGYGRGRLWPWADLEVNPSGLSAEQLDRWLAQFCAEVRRRISRESCWYGGLGGADGRTFVGRTASAPSCPVAIANYGPNRPGTTPPHLSGSGSDGRGGPALPTRFPRWHVWQFNSTTRVPGVADNTVDQDLVADDFWALMTGTAPAPMEEDYTMKGVLVSGVPDVNDSTVWEVTYDGNGRGRRLGIGDQDELGMLIDIGRIDSTVTLTGAKADRFVDRFPEANAVTSDQGALQLTELVRQDVAGLADELKAATAQVLAAVAPGAAVDPAGIDDLAGRIANRTADLLHDRLAS